ncbi:MAG: hypothetical protein PF630_04905 [Gammaproteobacteria bacterium]|jgi:hypothetical protein|nr:hypothetical protein [Gammaproteobacteria bacterium]
MATLCVPLLARPDLGPPSIKLRSNMSNIVLAELIEREEDEYLILKKIEDIHNQAEDRIRLRSLPDSGLKLSVGERYVVAYVNWRVQRFPRSVSPRRDGGVIIHLPGAEPAIFPPDTNLQSMLTWPINESLLSPSSMLPIILSGMNRDNTQLRDFFTTELVTRASLHPLLSMAQKLQILNHLRDDDYPPASRQLMLGMASFTEVIMNSVQREQIAAAIVTRESTGIAAGSERAGMISTALEVLKNSQQVMYADRVRRGLDSELPGLVEQAAAVIYSNRPAVVIDWLKSASDKAGGGQVRQQVLNNLITRYSRALALGSSEQNP